MTRLGVVFVAVLMQATVGCSREGGARNGPGRVEILDSSGIELVRNRYELFDTSGVRLVEELRIGVANGPEEYQFDQIFGLAVDTLGRTFVSNRGTRSVRVYDREGHWVRDIGRAGSGPGEFQEISPPAIWRDSLGLYDLAQMRFTLFDTTGQYLASWSMVLPDRRVIYPLKGGPAGWTVWINRLSMAQQPQPPGSTSRDTVLLGHVNLRTLDLALRNGEDADPDILGLVPWPGELRKWTVGERGPTTFGPLFAPDQQWSLDDAGRIYLSAGYPYQIDVYDEEGRLTRRVTRAFQARPVTDSEVEEYLSRLEQSGPSRVSEARLRSVRTNAELNRAEYFGATRTLIASKEGAIWIERPDARFDLGNYVSIPGFESGPRYWDAFDVEGRYQFTVKAPDRFTARWIDEHSVMGVQRDENDVEYVVRYRVER